MTGIGRKRRGPLTTDEVGRQRPTPGEDESNPLRSHNGTGGPRRSGQPVMIRCNCCGGSGRIELTGKNAETLALLRTMKEPTNGAALARMYGCSNEAMCNRLRVIEGYGLAKSRKWGRDVFWEAV